MADGDEDVLTTPETPASGQDDALQTETEQGDVAEEELEEIEFSGKKYSVPKSLKGGFMMQADYTRKTQELAEHRRGFDSEREAFTKEVEARRGSLREEGLLSVMDDQIEQYQRVDWATWRANDP